MRNLLVGWLAIAGLMALWLRRAKGTERLLALSVTAALVIGLAVGLVFEYYGRTTP